jgi:SNF2 family DNA or RNA helicase
VIVLHGTWLAESDAPPKGLLFLWGEKPETLSTSSGTTARRRGRAPRAGVPLHPFQVPAEALSRLPGVENLVRSTRRARRALLLPSARGGPLPSLAWAGDASVDDERPALRPWTVEGIGLPAADVPQLPSLLGEPEVPDALRLGSDARLWIYAAELSLELLAGQRFTPGFVRDAGGHLHAVWSPALHRTEDQQRLSALAAAMPDACRCGAGADSGDRHPPGPRPYLVHFLSSIVDAAVRRAFSAMNVETDSPWLRALCSDESLVQSPEERCRFLEREWAIWSEPIRTPAGRAPLRTCFRLDPPPHPPQDGSEEAPRRARRARWALRFLLQATDDLSLLIPAARVWASSAREMTLLKKRFEDPQERLLFDLGRASRLFPPLEQSLRSPRPAGTDLDTHEAHAFLREAAPLLEEWGFGVQVPSWWDRTAGGAGGLGIRIRLSPRREAGRIAASGLGLDALVRFDWEVAIGEERLSPEEFAQLVAMKVPLVQVRGQWVELRADLVDQAIRFLDPRQRQGELRLQEAMHLALGRDSDALGFPVVGVEAEGWVGEFLDRLRAQEKVEMVPVPSGFRGTLRPYQQWGVSWLAFLHRWGLGACLADDMGLGKTVQFLALLLHERDQGRLDGPSLLICPTSVVGNWQREAARFAPSLQVMVHHGPDRLTGREFARAAAASDLVITSYALVHRDVQALGGVRWAYVTLDEAQNIKNPETKQARCVRLIPSPRRVALTGTPVENRLSELWSIMDFLNGGYLGPRGEFRRSFAIPIERYRSAQVAERLKTLIQPFVLRRLKTDPRVIRDLPEKLEMKVYCPLTREQATLYQAVVRDMMKQIQQSEGIQRKGLVLSTLTKLKQVCNHPALFLKDGSALEGRSGKFVRLSEMLEEALAEGDRALIFTQFAEMGEMLRRALQANLGREVLFLHGGVPRKARDVMTARFQAEDGPALFVLSLRAGGFGLNLTRANRVFHFDRWWNPAVEEQATDRAFRIGQTRNVAVHKFLCQGTLEENIDAMIEGKKELAQMTIGAGEAWITELSTDQLRDLFALRADAVGE